VHSIAKATEQYSGADVDALVERAKEYVPREYLGDPPRARHSQEDLVRAGRTHAHHAGLAAHRPQPGQVRRAATTPTRDLERYLKANKLL
jgi:hypothetical protein